MPSSRQWGPIQAQSGTLNRAADVLERTAARHPDRVYALVSGGHDSLTAMHVAHASDALTLDGVVHINTGVGIPQTRAFVRERAAALGLPFIEVGSAYRWQTDEYRTLVRKFGFPGPPVHKLMYANLKEKPLQWWLSEQHGDEAVAFVSGVRKAESERRMETIDDAGIQRKLGASWASPLIEFTGTDVRRYRRANDLPMNPVVDLLEMSGECLCGAFGDRAELHHLRRHFRNVWRCLQDLEADVIDRAQRGLIPREHALWGHGGQDARELDARLDDDQMTMCAGCERRAACDAWRDRDTNPATVHEATESIEYQPDRPDYVGEVEDAPTPREAESA